MKLICVLVSSQSSSKVGVVVESLIWKGFIFYANACSVNFICLDLENTEG